MFSLRFLLRHERCLVALLTAFFLVSMGANIYFLAGPNSLEPYADGSIHTSKKLTHSSMLLDKKVATEKEKKSDEVNMSTKSAKKNHDPDIGKNMEEENEEVADEHFPKPNYNLHAFYYPWYGNPSNNGKYLHWNHEYLQHWDRKVAAKWPKGSHVPPDDIGASFYPELGPYSSKDNAIIEEHMKQMRHAGIGVLAVSWYPPDEANGQGEPFDKIVPLLLKAALKYKMKVCLHIEPFKDRSAPNFLANLKYIISQYGDHPAFYKREHKGRLLPLYYIYDSYQIQKDEWARLFMLTGDLSVRGTNLDGIFIGLLVEGKHRQEIALSGFDGFYTYFASNGFTYGSKISNWKNFATEAESRQVLFIPSVGPGYMDERVRPWNGINTKERNGGEYYEKSFAAAVAANPPIITITSFNEWHEGTQIEKAVPKEISKFKYLDYSPNESDYYLSLTRKWSLKFAKQKRSQSK